MESSQSDDFNEGYHKNHFVHSFLTVALWPSHTIFKRNITCINSKWRPDDVVMCFVGFRIYYEEYNFAVPYDPISQLWKYSRRPRPLSNIIIHVIIYDLLIDACIYVRLFKYHCRNDVCISVIIWYGHGTFITIGGKWEYRTGTVTGEIDNWLRNLIHLINFDLETKL